MIPALRSEFRKLLTVRSTYVTTILVGLFVALISFWPEGINLNAEQLRDAHQLSGDIGGSAVAVDLFAGIVAILLMSNEYRHNTIMYTLTATNNRLKTLLAKFVVISLYGLFFAALIGLIAPLLSLLGVHVAGHSLGPQMIDYGSVIWRALYVGWGMAAAGLVIAVIIRNQIGAIVTMLAVPLIAENALTPLIKDNVNYLPFHSLFDVVQPTGSMSSEHGALLFGAYIIVGAIVAALLFVRRDAN